MNINTLTDGGGVMFIGWEKITDDWGNCLMNPSYWLLFWGTHIFPVNPSIMFAGLLMILTVMIFPTLSVDGIPANFGVFFFWDSVCFILFPLYPAYKDNKHLLKKATDNAS